MGKEKTEKVDMEHWLHERIDPAYDALRPTQAVPLQLTRCAPGWLTSLKLSVTLCT
ncbi:Uncharacterised protein [Achromobacter xylosoxidans]|nr:Uncharacterised protein [Achromobacter xylosoxidans]